MVGSLRAYILGSKIKLTVIECKPKLVIKSEVFLGFMLNTKLTLNNYSVTQPTLNFVEVGPNHLGPKVLQPTPTLLSVTVLSTRDRQKD